MSDQVPAWAKNPPPFPEDPSEVDHVVEIIAQQLNESCQIGKAIHSGTTSSTAVILREVLRNELANQGMDKKLIYSDDIEKIYIKGSLHIFSSDIDIPYPIHCAHELLMDGIKFLNDALDSPCSWTDEKKLQLKSMLMEMLWWKWQPDIEYSKVVKKGRERKQANLNKARHNKGNQLKEFAEAEFRSKRKINKKASRSQIVTWIMSDVFKEAERIGKNVSKTNYQKTIYAASAKWETEKVT